MKNKKILRRIYLFFCTILLAVGSQAQSPVTITPAQFYLDDSITITFNATLGNRGLLNEIGDVFLFAGLINETSVQASDWRYGVPGQWTSYPQSTKLTRIDSNTYSIRILPRAYFQVPAGEDAKSMALLFRNQDAAKVGRATRDADILYPISQRTEWWNETVFYEIFVRSFQDSNGDGIGDFPGLTSRLPYLKELGIKGIWLMPINPSPSYHGYDVTNYKGINPQYGTLAQFRTFLDSAHRMGIKVVMDYVMNHSSSQHRWFQQSAQNIAPYNDFYRWSDTLPNQPGPWGQTVWHFNSTRNKYYYGVFYDGMPDINYNNAAVKDSIFEAATFWLNNGVDGFRLDAIQYLLEDGNQLANTSANIALCNEFKALTKSVNSQAMTVGEVWSDLNSMLLYRKKLDYCFEFNLSFLNTALAGYGDSTYTSNFMGYTTYINYNNYPNQAYGNFIANHDQNRVYDAIGQNVEKCRIAANLLLSMPGIPYLYYGEEIAMSGSGPDEEKRTPMLWTDRTRGTGAFTTGTPWRGNGNATSARNVRDMQTNPQSLWNQYKKLIGLRNNVSALRKGNIAFLETTNPLVIAGYRQYADSSVIVLINPTTSVKSNISINLPTNYINAETTNFLNLMDGSVTHYDLGEDANLLTGIRLAPAEIKIFQVTNRQATTSVFNKEKISFECYPNPATNQLNLILPEPWLSEKEGISVYDIQGRMVLNKKIEANQTSTSIDLNKLKSGIYIVSIQSAYGTLTKRIVKQ